MVGKVIVVVVVVKEGRVCNDSGGGGGGDSGGGGSEGRKGLYCGSAAKYVRAEPVRSKTPPPSQSAINTCHMHGWNSALPKITCNLGNFLLLNPEFFFGVTGQHKKPCS